VNQGNQVTEAIFSTGKSNFLEGKPRFKMLLPRILGKPFYCNNAKFTARLYFADFSWILFYFSGLILGVFILIGA